MEVILAGTGAGTKDTWSAQVISACEKADLIIGASRMLSFAEEYPARKIKEFRTEKIVEEIEKAPDDSTICVLFSGDIGFYSGAGPLEAALKKTGKDMTIVRLCGISSIQLLSAAIGEPWQDWKLVSAHGRDCNVEALLREEHDVFFLTGGAITPGSLFDRMKKAGCGERQVIIGERLGTAEQRVIFGTAGELASRDDFDSLSCVLIRGEKGSEKLPAPGWPDEVFVRGDVPMTKRDVRSSILSRLDLSSCDTVYDIGAGTGSVSCEMAAIVFEGSVYAFEKEHEACLLIEKNRENFRLWNLFIKEGRAPDVIEGFPAPDAVFVGGSTGELPAIIDRVTELNPKVRICISAVMLETAVAGAECLEKHGIDAEISQIAVTGTKKIGGKHMMKAENPIFLVWGCQR